MNESTDQGFVLQVEPTNPGQFFACCGILELADRLWGGAEGFFSADGRRFELIPQRPGCEKAGAAGFREALLAGTVRSVLPVEQLARRDQLARLSKLELKRQKLEGEKKSLDGLYRNAPVVLELSVPLLLDWFADERAGASAFKTWAGQQCAIEIAKAMHGALRLDLPASGSSLPWLQESAFKAGLPFFFDSDLAATSATLDLGFHPDPLKGQGLDSPAHPALEFFAFVGLQRFRPAGDRKEGRFRYVAWSTPLTPPVAAVAACGVAAQGDDPLFEFRLLYRSKYLKSLLPARPVRDAR